MCLPTHQQVINNLAFISTQTPLSWIFTACIKAMFTFTCLWQWRGSEWTVHQQNTEDTCPNAWRQVYFTVLAQTLQLIGIHADIRLFSGNNTFTYFSIEQQTKREEHTKRCSIGDKCDCFSYLRVVCFLWKKTWTESICCFQFVYLCTWFVNLF